MSENYEIIHAVAFRSSEDLLPLIEEFVSGNGYVLASYDDLEAKQGTSYVICDSETEARQALEVLRQALPEWTWMFDGRTFEMDYEEIRKENWAETWKQYFHAFRASDRLVIKPSWEDFEASPDDILIELDPGMCFGTGYHGTTKACLQFMDELNAKLGPMSFIDAGCGSGILSMAARKLGYAPVLAFDNDPQCIDVSKENLALAKVDGVDLQVADVFDFQPKPAKVVAANILAVILMQVADSIIKYVDISDGEGYLILSGILNEQYPELLAKFTGLGLEEIDRRTINEWTSGLFRVTAK